MYYLHRIEPGRDLKESIGALNGLKQKGKCKYIGLSECSADTLRKACAGTISHDTTLIGLHALTDFLAVAKIDALQIEYSPWFTDHEQNGLIEAARELGVTIIAYSPLGKGMLTGTFTSPDQFGSDLRARTPRFQAENFEKNSRIVEEFKRLAAQKSCTPGQLSLAWVMAQGAIPIPGTRRIERMEENFNAGDITLSEEDLQAIRKVVEEAKPVGPRLVLCAPSLEF